MISMILLVFALVLFVIGAAVNRLDAADPWRGRLLCLGLACMAGSELVSHVPMLGK